MDGVGTIQDISRDAEGLRLTTIELLYLKGRLIQMIWENKQLVRLGSICGAEWDATANYSKVKALPVRRIYYWLQIRRHLQLLMNLDTVSVHAFSTPATGKYGYCTCNYVSVCTDTEYNTH